MAKRVSLGKFLIKPEVIGAGALQQLLEQQHDGFWGHTAFRGSRLSEGQLRKSLSEMKSIQDLDSLCLDESFHVLPIFIHHGILYLAMANPSDLALLQHITGKTRMQIKPLLAPKEELQAMIAKHYAVSQYH